MKKKYLGLLKIVEDDSPVIGGLARSSYSSVNQSASGTTLTLKNLEKTYKYFTSKKYQKRVAEENYRKAKGVQIVGNAYAQGIITEEEYYRLMMGIQINGMLMVRPDMYERLEATKITL